MLKNKFFCAFLVVFVLLSSFSVSAFAEESVVVENTTENNIKEESGGIYNHCYDLISYYVYGDVLNTSESVLICTALASFLSIFVVAFPFVIVWFVIKLILSVGTRLL